MSPVEMLKGKKWKDPRKWSGPGYLRAVGDQSDEQSKGRRGRIV